MKKPFAIGLVAGLLATVPHLLYYYKVLPPDRTLGSLIPYEILLILLTVPIGIFVERNRYEKGKFYFADSFKTGMRTAGIGALVLALFTYIYFKFIDLETVTEMLKAYEQSLTEAGYEQEKIKEAVDGRREFLSPAIQAVFPLLFCMFGGGVVSLLSSLVLSKFPPRQVG